MDGATATSCAVSCTRGCVRAVSCNPCNDPLCAVCTGFATGLCSSCVSNASGTPCACNINYKLSADGFSCEACPTGCSACTGTSYYQCSACSTGYYLLKTQCLTYCPNGYTASGTTCTLSIANCLSLAFQDLIQLDTVSGISVGASSINLYPTWESTDPIPAIDRGYYFSGSNYLSLASHTIGPWFSILFWVRPLVDGYLFMKYDGLTKYSFIRFAGGIPSVTLRMSDSSTFTVAGTTSLLNN